MCGIIIAKDLEKLLELFDTKVYTRGTDSVGILDSSSGRIYTRIEMLSVYNKKTKVWDKLKIQDEIDIYKESIMRWSEKYKCKGPFLFHNRKASLGGVNLKNAHPFKMKGFVLMQNGTNEVFKKWAEVESIIHPDIDVDDRSDTYALAKCIEKNWDKREEILNLAVGVIVIRAGKTKGDVIEIYSDGKRSFEYDAEEDIYASQFGATEKTIMEGKLVLNRKTLEKIEEESTAEFKEKFPIPNPEVRTRIYAGDEERRMYNNGGYNTHTSPSLQHRRARGPGKYQNETEKAAARLLAAQAAAPALTSRQTPFTTPVRTFTSAGYYTFSPAQTTEQIVGAKRFKKSILIQPNYIEIIKQKEGTYGKFYKIFKSVLETVERDKKAVYRMYQQFLAIKKVDHGVSS